MANKKEQIKDEEDIVRGNGHLDDEDDAAWMQKVKERYENTKNQLTPELIATDVKTLKEQGVLGAWSHLTEKHIVLFSSQEAMEAATDPHRTVPLSKVKRDAYLMYARSYNRGGLDDIVALTQSKQEEKEQEERFGG